MKDLYSFHDSQEDLDQYYEEARAAYDRIFDRLGIGDRTVFTYASGGDFSKYSHEFQTLAESGEDTIYQCNDCDGTAINKEIIDETPCCPDCNGTDFTEVRAIEVGNIFKLSDRFSSAFNVTLNVPGKGPIHPIMGCYGIGPSRVMATMVEVLHDEKGMRWPDEAAPARFHITPLGRGDVAQFANQLYEDLRAQKETVILDDRSRASAGVKFATADLIGASHRVVVSNRTQSSGQLEVVHRMTGKVTHVDPSQLRSISQ